MHSRTSYILLNKKAQKILKRINKNLSKEDIFTQNKELIDQLQSHHIIIPKGKRLHIKFHSPDTIAVWYHITNACQLRCSYCYVCKDSHSMSDELIEKSINSIFLQASKDKKKIVSIKFAGGEPSLVFDKILKAHNLAKEAQKRYKIKYKPSILSNGVLLDNAKIDFFIKEGFVLMISLDGVKSVHDKQRIFSNGRGSYDVVMQNIDKCISKGLYPFILITITNQSVDKLYQLVEKLLEKKLLFAFSFFRETEAVQTKTVRNKIKYDDQKFIKGLLRAFKVIELKLPDQDFTNILGDRAKLSNVRRSVCEAGTSYFLLSDYGKISKCQMLLNEPITDIADPDFLKKLKDKTISISNPSVNKKQKCKNCIWKYQCCGGCPLLARSYYGQEDRPSPFCNIYKAIFPEILRLDALRAIKYYKEN
ncbi:MAG: radical SAM protein [bacterium]